MTRLLGLSLALGLAGCGFLTEDDRALGSVGAFADYQTYLDEREALLAELDDLIGAAEAAGPAACRVVAIGVKACGGPAGYRVYSADASDAGKVEALAEEVAALDRQAIRQFGLVSTCDVPSEPAVVFRGGRCLAQPAQ